MVAFKKKSFKIITIVVATVMACIFCACSLCLFGVLGVNEYVKGTTSDYILSPNEAADLQDVDCILVLGCQVKESGYPSAMLRDRLSRGVELYHQGVAPKLLMSGDHGQIDYNEVGTMKQFAIDCEIPSEDVFMDHAGFSTYESMWRAKEIFGVKKIVIVTQNYHLYRAIYIARSMGIEAYGVDSDYQTYWGQTKREVREILARCKDVVTTILEVPPTYGGDKIPITGSGDLTND